MNFAATHVIIPAGGSGLRFGGSTKKQFLELKGEPVLHHTIRRFLAIEGLKSVVVSLPADEIGTVSSVLTQKFEGVVVCTEGGETRSESVHCGFQRLRDPEAHDVVLIHDAVRPLVSAQVIERVSEATQKHGAAVPGVAVTDTIKQVDEQNTITQTIPRADLRAAQTPQGFRYALLEQAYRDLDFCSPEFTDESLLVEALGQQVVMVEGDANNVKITRPLDLEWAERMLP